MVFTEIVQSLGLGQKATMAAMMGLAVLYLLRARSASRRLAGFAATVWTVALSVSIAAAVSIYLGWVDPAPAVFISDVWTAFRTGVGLAWDLLPWPISIIPPKYFHVWPQGIFIPFPGLNVELHWAAD